LFLKHVEKFNLFLKHVEKIQLVLNGGSFKEF
jgi:hypothetical protein